MAPTGAVGNRAGAWAWVAWPTMRASGRKPSFSACEARISTIAAAPSEIDDELAGVTVPSLRKAGLRVGIFSMLAENGCSSASTATSPLRPATVTATISQAKLPSVVGGLGPAQRADREFVLRFTGEAVAAGAILGEGAHQAAAVFLGVGVFEAVHEHVVDDLAVAEAIAAARLGQQVGGVGHRLHAADHGDVAGTGQQAVMADHGRLHAGAADLADHRAAGRQRQAGEQGGLPRRRLADTGRQHAAEQDFLDERGVDAGALDRGLDGRRPELRRRSGWRSSPENPPAGYGQRRR